MMTGVLDTPAFVAQQVANEMLRYAYAVGSLPVVMMATTVIIVAIGIVGFKLTNMLPPPRRPRRRPATVLRPRRVDVEDQIQRPAA